MDVNELYNNVKTYFDSLNKEAYIFENSNVLHEACKDIVTIKFGSVEEDRNAYLENTKNLYALLRAIQPWYSYNLNINQIEIDETLKNFQLSLALCDEVSSMKYKERYEALVYKLFLNIALNINKKEYFDEFVKYSEAWYGVINCSSKEIYIAIMFKQKDNIEDLDKFISILEHKQYGNYITVSNILSSDLMNNNTEELKKLLNESVFIAKSHERSMELLEIGSTTDNIDIAFSVVDKIRYDREDLKFRVQSNIVMLKSDISVKESLKYLSTIKYTQSSIEELKYNIAIKIFLHNENIANEIIDSLSLEYRYGFQAYKFSNSKDEKSINILIDEVLHMRELDDANDHTLLKIVFSILKNFPLIADTILDKLHANWGLTLTAQSEIALLIASVDIDKSIEYLKKIEEKYIQEHALIDMIIVNNKEGDLIKLLEIVCDFKNIELKYQALSELNKKIDVPFSLLEEVASKIKPYDDFR